MSRLNYLTTAYFLFSAFTDEIACERCHSKHKH